jgi:uncharacterized membrane protein
MWKRFPWSVALLGVVFAGLAGWALVTGHVRVRYGDFYTRAESPGVYWFVTGAWLFVALLSTYATVKLVLRDSNDRSAGQG